MSAAVYRSANIEIQGFGLRQAEAIAHTFEGLTAKEAARAMGVSPRTVEMYLNLAMQRLGATNRVHLAIRAYEAGVLVIKRSALAVVCAITLATAPASDLSTDDLSRLTARTVRVRRNRDDLLTSPTTADEHDV